MKFSPKGLDFLVENKMRDDREWFRANRGTYEKHIIAPMSDLIMKLEPTIHAIDENMICEPKITRSISRIFRDTRFSKDKSIFRDTVWCVFTRDKKLYEGPPAFYFEFSPNHINFGCGFYRASTDAMEKLRENAIKNTKAFKEAQKAYQNQSVFTMYGQMYKKSKFPDAPDSVREWVDRKTIGFEHYSTDFDWLFGDTVAEDLANYFKLLEPCYKLMLKCME